MLKKAGLSALSALFTVSLVSASGFDLNSGSLAAGYADLAWAKASQWDEFVTWINQP